MDVAFFFARAILGLGLAAHGAQKLFGWFGGRGIDGTAEFFSTLGFHPARNFAVAEGLAELTGGTLTAIGFRGPRTEATGARADRGAEWC